MKNVFVLAYLLLICSICNSQEWITHNSYDNTFKVKFPEQPKATFLKSGYGIDSTRIYQCFKNDSSDSYVFDLTIMYLSNNILKPDFTEENRFEILERYSVTKIRLIGKVLSSQEILMNGYPGIFITGEITQAVQEKPYPPIYIKSCIVENRIYQLSVSCSYENKESPTIDYFFDSFELASN